MEDHYQWDVFTKSSYTMEFSHAFVHFIKNDIFEKQLPQFSHLAPFKAAGYHANLYKNDDWFIFYIKDTGASIPAIGNFNSENELFNEIINLLPFKEYTYEEMEKIIQKKNWIDYKTFLYMGKIKNGNVSWRMLTVFIIEWLQGVCLPRIEELNHKSVMHALKDSPVYVVNNLLAGLCVLECEETSLQGTGFYLKGMGIITCSHSVGTNTKVFLASDPSKKFDVKVLKRSTVIDLAVLSSDIKFPLELEKGEGDSLNQMDHLLVTGFPNYRIGDSGVVIPGIITAHRIVSSIRRILTNASIVAGCSGGPVFDKDSKVIGVAVTGSDNFSNAQNTEDHAIIPIEALNLF